MFGSGACMTDYFLCFTHEANEACTVFWSSLRPVYIAPLLFLKQLHPAIVAPRPRPHNAWATTRSGPALLPTLQAGKSGKRFQRGPGMFSDTKSQTGSSAGQSHWATSSFCLWLGLSQSYMFNVCHCGDCLVAVVCFFATRVKLGSFNPAHRAFTWSRMSVWCSPCGGLIL